jgi:hypothetical protein
MHLKVIAREKLGAKKMKVYKNERFFDILNTGEDQVFLQPKILLKLFGGG